MTTTSHPVEAKLSTGRAMFVPSAGLYSLEFRDLPSEAELAEYARYRANECRDKIKAARGSAGRAVREHNQRMFERWQSLAVATRIRVESMREKQAKGEALKVYF